MNASIMTSAALLEAGGSTVGSTISLAITAIVLVYILFGVLFGLKRGMYKTAVRLITIAAAAVISFCVVTWLTDYLNTFIVGKTVEEVITTVWPGYVDSIPEEYRNIVNCFDAETVESLLATILVMVLMPIIYIIVFMLIKLIIWPVYFIIQGLIGAGGHQSVVSKLIGGTLGAVQGVVIAGVMLLPISGLAGVIADSRDHLTTGKEPWVGEAIEDAYVNYLDEPINHPFFEFINAFGVEAAYADLVTIDIGSEKNVDMRKELEVLAEIAADAAPLVSDGLFDWTHLRDTDKTAITAILSDVGEDEHTAKTVAGVLRGIAKAHSENHFELGFEEPFDQFMTEFVSIFLTADKDNLNDDLTTFVNVYFLLNDHDVLAHFSTMTMTDTDAQQLFAADKDGKSVINHVIDTLNENPRTKPLVNALTKFSLQLMSESVGNALPEGADMDQVYEEVKTGMTGVLDTVNDPTIPEEERKEVVKESLNTALVDSGVLSEDTRLDDETMNNITDYVMENFEGKTELTDDDINSAIFSYYTQHGIPDGVVVPDDVVIPEN